MPKMPYVTKRNAKANLDKWQTHRTQRQPKNTTETKQVVEKEVKK